jgi:hypothetical protein
VKLLRCLGAAAVLSAATLARADLTGTTVEARLDASAEAWQQPTATVGPGVEFTGSLASGMVQAALDLSPAGLTFSLINRSTGNEFNPDGIIDLGLRGFQLDNLVSTTGPVRELTLLSSTFPAGTFDRLNVMPGRVVWTAPELIMPGRGTLWQATWRIAH